MPELNDGGDVCGHLDALESLELSISKALHMAGSETSAAHHGSPSATYTSA